jgi:hypothetical protein
MECHVSADQHWLPSKASILMWIFLCDILHIINGQEIARCSSVPIAPQTGLCKGFVLHTKICTGDSNIFTSNYSALVDKNQKITQSLESYTWDSYCRTSISKICKSYLPSTSVFSTYLSVAIHEFMPSLCFDKFHFF